jgi:serine phosphatase RsbU (regulator of sigma subunit)
MQVWFTPLLTTAAAYVLMLFVIRAAAQDRQEKLRLSGELAAAAEIQTLLLPSKAAEDVESVYLPASEVGGDFYQVLERDDGSRAVLVGDVSGKGLKAAMLVSVAIGILRNEKSSSPAAILSALNRGLHGQTGGGFVTCCCLRLGEQVTAASAGHPAPYADGREAAIPCGLPLGIAAEANYEEAILTGSALTLVSDGVIEAANAAGELFGFDRTREISTKSAQTIAEAARAWGQNDDITVVTVRRTA